MRCLVDDQDRHVGPAHGSSKGQTDTIVNAFKLAFEEVDYTVGDFTIVYEDLDDATPARGAWDAGKEAENANKAVADADVIVYLGHFNSDAAKVAIPTLTRAGLVMISPANTYPGLTKPGKGEPNEPDIYYPTGVRNYALVVPADDLQGAVAATWARSMGMTRVYELDDTELYGHGIAEVFAETAQKIGLGVVAPSKLTGKGAEWYQAYKAKFGSEPEAYAAYGYEAARVALNAIMKAGTKDREAIRAAVFATANYDGVLGTWSFDANGDTSLTTMSGRAVVNGRFDDNAVVLQAE
jgi:ABC-type branched-subunit amino acid transport system substrate-binding protein